MRSFLIILLLLGFAAQAKGLDLPGESTKISGGLACFIHPESMDQRPIELAQTGRFLVYIAAKDHLQLNTYRTQGAELGLLGRSLYVELRPEGTLPHADHLVDLVMAPTTVNETELRRVLSPVRGRGFFGDRLISKAPLPGSDDWTHRMHGSDNNPVSADKAFRTPTMFQYLEMPMQTSFQGTMLAAGGWRVELSDWATKKPDRNDVAGELLVRSLHNGRILWQRDLPKPMESDMPRCALDKSTIYLADATTCQVLVLDAEFGDQQATLVLDSDPNLRVNWLAIEDGKLYALLGQQLPTRHELTFIGGANAKLRNEQFKSGNILVARELASGQELWRHREPGTIDYRTLAVRERRVYFYSEQSRLACLDANGQILWENRDRQWLDTMPRPSLLGNLNFEANSTLIVGPSGQLRLSVARSDRGFLFSTQDGKLLWENRVPGPKSLFLGNRYLTPKGIFDADSGKLLEKASSNVEGTGCGLITWVPGLEKALCHVSFGVKSPCGVGAYTAGGVLIFSPSQCDCWPHLRGAAGFIEAEQTLQRVRQDPTHPLEYGDAAAPTLSVADQDWAQYRGNLHRLGATATEASATARVRHVSKPTSPYPVPDGHSMQRLEWLERPTPPITAGGLAFVAASDGSVRAVRIASGETVWTYWTGGAVLTSPSFAAGRLFVGSADGWVYCLDAETGKLAWRWRGAPMERRVMVYGKLVSTWPVTAVLADKDRVYGVAGQWMQNGSVSFALDAATGHIVWTRWIEPSFESREFLRDGGGFGPAGQLTLIGKNLWVRSYLGVPGIFDADTGVLIPPTRLIQLQRQQDWALGVRLSTAGSDLLVVDEHLVLQGGQPLMINPDIRHDKTAARFIAYYLDSNGELPADPLARPAIPSSQVAPAIADQYILMTGGKGRTWRSEDPTSGLSLWTLNAWRKEFEHSPQPSSNANQAVEPVEPAEASQTPKGLSMATGANNASDLRSGFTLSLDMTKAQWRIDEIDVSAIAIARDVAIVAHGERQSWRRSDNHPGFRGWKLSALNLTDGQTRWSVDLPGEPIFNGLAATADGTWLIVLRDGSLVTVDSHTLDHKN